MVMIEHFNKWVEEVALFVKESCEIARVFRQYVLCWYGARVEVVTGLGTVSRDDFQEMLDEVLIDHRRTSRDHPQANG